MRGEGSANQRVAWFPGLVPWPCYAPRHTPLVREPGDQANQRGECHSDHLAFFRRTLGNEIYIRSRAIQARLQYPSGHLNTLQRMTIIRMTITCLLRQRINDGNNYNKSYMLEFRIRDGSGQCKASVLESNKVT